MSMSSKTSPMRPTMIQVPSEIPNMTRTSFSLGQRPRVPTSVSLPQLFSGQLRPRPHVREAAFVARDDDLRAALDRVAGVAARAGAATRVRLRVDDLSRAARADRHRHAPEDADHLEVGGFEEPLVPEQDLRQKDDDDGRSG